MIDERTVYYILAVVVGVAVNHFWAKFKNRTSVLECLVNHAYLGQTMEHPLFGSFQILHNGNPIKVLHMSKVLITNRSYKDLSNIEINIVSSVPNSLILISQGRNVNIHTNLMFSEQYAKVLAEQKQENLPFLLGRRDYNVPVLNRDDQLEFDLLVSNNDGGQPFLLVSCNSPGTKIKHVQLFPCVLGESQEFCSRIGLVLTVLLVSTILYYVDNKIAAVIISTIVGLGAQLWAALLLKLYKFILKILS